jgi:hypothetical protein
MATHTIHDCMASRNSRFVKVDASDPKAVARTLEIIRLLYTVHSNSWSPLYRIRKNVRFYDLQKVFAHCWRGAELPDDDAGRDHLYIAACHIWHLDKTHGWIATLRAWVKQWAPWCHTDELSELIDLVEANPRTWTADELAHELGLHVLPFSVRQALGMSKITGHGCDVVDGLAASRIALEFPQKKQSEPIPVASPAKPDLAGASLGAQSAGARATDARSEVLILKPTLWGMSIDLKEAYRRVRRRWLQRNA